MKTALSFTSWASYLNVGCMRFEVYTAMKISSTLQTEVVCFPPHAGNLSDHTVS